MSFFNDIGVLAKGYTMEDFLDINSAAIPDLHYTLDSGETVPVARLPRVTQIRALGMYRLNRLREHGIITEEYAMNTYVFMQTCPDEELITI